MVIYLGSTIIKAGTLSRMYIVRYTLYSIHYTQKQNIRYHLNLHNIYVFGEVVFIVHTHVGAHYTAWTF